MQYTSVNIQGNIISGELLSQLREQDYKHQNAQSFGLDKNANVRDEIGNAWAVLRRQWETFKIKMERLDEKESGMVETRQYWITHLLGELGYDIQQNRKKEQDTLPHINYVCTTPENIPVHIVGYNQSLDKRPAKGGSSPHGRMQEYLNKTDDHLYGLITNGKYLRLLRDASRLVKLTYLEFDMEKIMEEELYADFAVLYRVLHASRMPQKTGEGDESIMEEYHQDSLAAGTRIRAKLSEAVEKSIVGLANGFLQHPGNHLLQENIRNGKISPFDFYQHMLRLIYRILFLSVIEERHLVFNEHLTPEEQKLRDIYYRFYSMERLRKLAGNHHFVDKHKQDLWDNLRATFRLFQDEKYGQKLGIKPLAGDLFSSTAIGILADCYLSNSSFMQMMLWLNFFENENQQLVRVNYGDLDVEEFGSVYEGLLEYDPHIDTDNGHLEFSFIAGDARARSGSHYTPEELVKPLIKHSLDYIISDCVQKPHERLQMPKEETLRIPRKELQEKALLDINVCDVTCGSGHILLSVARRIATTLATVRTGDEQPDPASMRLATRDVIRNCIYGVDLNPLAVELCKVAMWLEAHTPGEPLNFLDHRIKCGDAIVGLAHKEELEEGIANEAFKKMPDDDKDIAKTFSDTNKKERKEREAKEVQLKAAFEETTENSVQEAMEEYKTFKNLPESTPAEIERKAKAYKLFIEGKGYGFLKTMADTKVAQFFIPKTTENKDRLMTDGDFRQIMSGYQGYTGPKTAYASSIAQQKKFFHYFLEFPEIFVGGGFDCILGNPPFLGGQRLSGFLSHPYLEFIKYNYAPIGAVDLVTYFFRRIFNIIKQEGFQSLISTNTIAQGDARRDGLKVILQQEASINHAVKSMRWPGLAAVEVSLVTITKQNWQGKYVLNGEEVEAITSYLDDSEPLGDPFKLKANAGKSFQGSIVLGKGFVLEPEEAQALIAKDRKNKDVLFPYLNGDDLNSNPDQRPSRWVINFFDWPIEKAQQYPDCLEIVEEKVKPERLKSKGDRGAKYWWQFLRLRKELYQTIAPLERVLVINRHTKYIHAGFIKTEKVFSDATVIISLETFSGFSIFSSNLHTDWAWKNSATMGSSTLRFSPSDCFETFPFPKEDNSENLKSIGQKYHIHREQLMLSIQLGLTKTYNAFHAPDIKHSIKTKTLLQLKPKEIEKQYGKETLNLWNHLQKTENTCSMEEAVEGIVILRELHVEMDNAVLEAYGWIDIDLRHDFYEVDYLPENDRVRFTIHPEARKEVLKRLLLLNHERFEEEAWQGLHKEKVVTEFYDQNGQPVPEGMPFSDKKTKATYKKGSKKKSKVEEPKQGYGGLFDKKE